MRRKDKFRAGSFQDAGRADKALPQVFAIEGGQRIIGDWVTLTVDGDPAALAIPQQCPDAHGVRKLLEQETVMLRVTPGKNGGFNGRLQRGGFVFHAVIASQTTKLIGINRLHRAFPGANLFREDSGNVRDRVKMQVAADVLVLQAGAQHERGSMNGAARGDYGSTAHADALALA